MTYKSDVNIVNYAQPPVVSVGHNVEKRIGGEGRHRQ